MISALALPAAIEDCPRLNNLCEAISRAQNRTETKCHGYISDETSPKDLKFEVYPFGIPSTDLWTVVSLRYVLKNKSLPRLTYRDRITLGPSIASSIVQLAKSPWIPEIVTSKDIFFLRRGDSLNYDLAYVTKSFPETSAASQITTLPSPFIKNRALFALGLLLIELILERPMEELGIPFDQAQGGSLVSLFSDSVVFDLLGNVNIRGGVNYYLSVKRCIYSEFQHTNLDFDDDKFRQEMYAKVIRPLEENLDST